MFFLVLSFIPNFSLSAKEKRIYVYKKQNGTVTFSNILPLHRKNLHLVKIFRISTEKHFVKNKRYSKKQIDTVLKNIAQTYGLDYNFLKAVAFVESGFKHNAVSNKGASGVMQLMPDTAKRFGVTNPSNVEENIKGGAKYLKYLLNKFNYNFKLALAAYNSGENTVVRYNGVPPYPETKKYVNKVFSMYRKYITNEKFF